MEFGRIGTVASQDGGKFKSKSTQCHPVNVSLFEADSSMLRGAAGAPAPCADNHAGSDMPMQYAGGLMHHWVAPGLHLRRNGIDERPGPLGGRVQCLRV